MSSYTKSSRSGSGSRSSHVNMPTPFCKVCYDAGLPVANYTNHFVKDQPGPNGKVVCPTLLAQKCLMCGVAGHTSSYCPEEMRREREQKERERDARRVSTCDANGWKVVGGGGGGAVVNSKSKPRIEAPSAQVTASRGLYGLLAVDDAESDHEHENEEEIQKMPASVPKPAPAAAAAVVEPAKPMTWAQRAAAASTKMPTPSTSTLPSSRSAAPVTDTRFQLNYLCNQIEVSRRAPSAKKAPAANHRANAAEVARESSLKRKQESVTIPA